MHDKVSGCDLFPLIYLNSCFFAIQMAHMGTIRLSPLVCPYELDGSIGQGCCAPFMASSLTDASYPAVL